MTRPRCARAQTRLVRSWSCVGAAVAMVAAALGGACGRESRAEANTPTPAAAEERCIRVELAQQLVHRPYLEVPANVLPFRKVAIIPEVPGRIVQITKDKGDAVEEGETLVVIDPGVYEDGVAMAEAQVALARTAAYGASRTLATLRPQMDRVQQMRDDGVASEAQADGVRTQVQQVTSAASAALAQVSVAEVGLRMAQTRLEDVVIKAPFAGVVAERMVDVGTIATAMPPTVVLLVMDIAQVRVEGSVPELLVGRLDAEAEVEVVLDAFPGAPVRARLAAVMSALDPVARTVPVSVTVPNDGRFRAFMAARLRLPLQAETWVTVPRPAILGDPSSGFGDVFVVGQDGTVTERRVTLGGRVEDRLQVVGVTAGERVAVSDLGRLRSGARVCVEGGVPAAAAGPAVEVEDAGRSDGSPPAATVGATSTAVEVEDAGASDGSPSPAAVGATSTAVEIEDAGASDGEDEAVAP